MVKPLTTREMELLHRAIVIAQQLSVKPANYEDLVRWVASDLSFKIDEDDIAELCENITGQ